MGALPRPTRPRPRWRRPVLLRVFLIIIGLGAGLAWMLVPRTGIPETPADRPLPAFETAGEALRITVFGTSLTADYSWPDGLQEALATCLARPVEVTRIAQGGMGSGWGMGQVPAVISSAPDLVLIEFGINDADLRRATTLGASLRRHNRIIGTLREARPGAGILLMTMTPATGIKRLIRPRLPDYDMQIRSMAETLDAGLADLAPRWAAAGMPPEDGVHPTDPAATEVILPVLTDLIPPALDAVCPA